VYHQETNNIYLKNTISSRTTAASTTTTTTTTATNVTSMTPPGTRSAEVTNKILKDTPKDTIPAVRTPRRQRSSRIFASREKQDLEKSPHFNGKFLQMYAYEFTY
jgi:hypothetical protein